MSSKDKPKAKSKEQKEGEKAKDTSKEHAKENKKTKKDQTPTLKHEISQNKLILEDKEGKNPRNFHKLSIKIR